jgi:hypothetical protein
MERPSGDHEGMNSPSALPPAAVSSRGVPPGTSATYSRFIALNTTCRPSGEIDGQRMSRARTAAPSSMRTGV